MKAATVIAGILTAALSSSASAGPQEDLVKAVVEAVKSGADLAAAFPGAVSDREIASLRRVSKCSARKPMKQEPGRYTILWNCGSKGMLGMEVRLVEARIASISTFEVVMRPNTGRY